MISVEEAINNFYKEKSKYESLLEKDKKSIIKNNDLSWKEKRVEYKKLKPKGEYKELLLKSHVIPLSFEQKTSGEAPFVAPISLLPNWKIFEGNPLP